MLIITKNPYFDRDLINQAIMWDEPSSLHRTMQDQAIATPPLSPDYARGYKSDDFLNFDLPFSKVVNPNLVLCQRFSGTDKNLNTLNTDDNLFMLDIEKNLNTLNTCMDSDLNMLNTCMDSDIRIKQEIFETDEGSFLKSLLENTCQHDVSKDLCNFCSHENIRDYDECAWELDDKDNLMASCQDFQSSRTRFDSTSSRYSVGIDPLEGAIACMAEPINFIPLMPDTPADTSDTDTTDSEEIACSSQEASGRPEKSFSYYKENSFQSEKKGEINTGEIISLEHSYHCKGSANPPKKSEDISIPLKNALMHLEEEDQDSDGEELNVDDDDDDDVEELVPDNSYFNVTPVRTHMNTLRVVNRAFPCVSNGIDNGRTPGKRGRKPGSTNGPRKVGRPPKNVKQGAMVGGVRKSTNRRPGTRAIQMDPQKREAHNCMERLRRVNLKSDFEHMCTLVPSLMDCFRNDSKKKAPAKVTILRSASEYVQELKSKELRQLDQIVTLNNCKKNLESKLNQLRHELGITNIEFG